MGLIGNTLGEVRYIDLPITAGTNPTVTWSTDEVLDLIGVQVLAAGATASALKVGGSAVAAGAISSFANNFGEVWADNPANGVPAASQSGTNGTGARTDTGVGFLNYQSSGTSQPVAATLTTATTATATTSLAVSALPVAVPTGSVVTLGPDALVVSADAAAGDTTLTVTSKVLTKASAIGSGVIISVGKIIDRNGNVPAPAALVPLDAAIASATAVEVDITGTVITLAGLPAADGNGFITLLNGNSQSGFTNGTLDSVPFRVKATDTTLDTFAGIVRLAFQVPFSDPNATAKAAGTYPNNGIQKGSAGIY